MQQLAGVADNVIPLKCGAGIHFVGLNVEVAQDPLVVLELVVRQFLENEPASAVFRIIALKLWKDFAQRRREPDQRLVLFRSEIVLNQILALDIALDRFRAELDVPQNLCPNPPVA